MYDYRNGSNVFADWSNTGFSRCSTRSFRSAWLEESSFAGDARGLRYRYPLSHVSRVRGTDCRGRDRTYRKRTAPDDGRVVVLCRRSPVFREFVRAGAHQSRHTWCDHAYWRCAFSNRLGMSRSIRAGQGSRVKLTIPFGRSFWFQSSAKGYGIARGLRRWDAVLPTPTRFPAHRIGRPRLKV